MRVFGFEWLCRGMFLAWVLAGPARAQELEVHFLAVGKGDAVLVRSPVGKTLLIDSGKDGRGREVILPALFDLGIAQLDFAVATHYDSDHVGGLDDLVRAGFVPGIAYDRGESGGTPPSDTYDEYRDAVDGVRQTIQPGDVIDLGGGVTATCYCVNGELLGGGSVSISGLGAFENAACVGLLIEYGSFRFWTAGDLPSLVEDAVAPLVGDVDVLKPSSQGGSAATSLSFVASLQPEVSFVLIGGNSSFPAAQTLERLNPPGGMTWIFQNEASSTGADGALLAHGSLRLVTDGESYRVDGGELVPRRFWCDEISGVPVQRGDVAIGELLAIPTASGGEYVEITNLTAAPLTLSGLVLRDNGSDLVSIASGAILEPRETLVLGENGDPRKNGGYTSAGVWPASAFGLADGADVIRLEDAGGTLVESLAYAGVSTGTAFERKDLYATPVGTNFAPGSTPFGDGDLGTPGAPNAADTTPWVPLLTGVEPAQGPFPGGTFVTLSGYDLDHFAAPQVRFGRAEASGVSVLDDRTLRVVLPPASLPLLGRRVREGLRVGVQLSNPNGLAHLPDAFLYALPEAAEPVWVPAF